MTDKKPQPLSDKWYAERITALERELQQQKVTVRALQSQLSTCQRVILAAGLPMPGGQDDLVFAQGLLASVAGGEGITAFEARYVAEKKVTVYSVRKRRKRLIEDYSPPYHVDTDKVEEWAMLCAANPALAGVVLKIIGGKGLWRLTRRQFDLLPADLRAEWCDERTRIRHLEAIKAVQAVRDARYWAKYKRDLAEYERERERKMNSVVSYLPPSHHDTDVVKGWTDLCFAEPDIVRLFLESNDGGKIWRLTRRQFDCLPAEIRDAWCEERKRRRAMMAKAKWSARRGQSVHSMAEIVTR